MELFQERGYARTTVEEIAARAGLAERTFFRYFNDKREVLFGGTSVLQEIIMDTIAKAPKATAPLDAMALALEAVATLLLARREFARARQVLIAANPELQERELIKLRALAATAVSALRKRGVGEPAASLTAEAGIAIFKVAYERWMHDPKRRELSNHIRASLAELKALAAGMGTATWTPRPTKMIRRKAPKPKLRPRARA